MLWPETVQQFGKFCATGPEEMGERVVNVYIHTD